MKRTATIRLFCILWAAAIIIMSVIPQSAMSGPTGVISDFNAWTMHFIAYYILMLLFHYGYGKNQSRLIIQSSCAVFSFSLALEICQIFTPYRSFQLSDLSVNAAGILFFAIIRSNAERFGRVKAENNTVNLHRNGKLNVLVLHNNLTPYRIPFFRALSQSKGYHFDFCFSSRKSTDSHQWKFEDNLGFGYDILSTKQLQTKYGTLYLLKNLNMVKKKYDLVVLSDHLNVPELTLQLYASIMKIPKLRWLELTKHSLESIPKVKIKLKSCLNRMSDGILVTGSESKEYAVSTTHREDNVYVCNYVIDNEFYSMARAVSNEKIGKLKEEFGLTNNVISFFGQFIQRKGLDVLLNALDLVDPKYKFSLLLVGTGPLKDDLLSRLKQAKRCPFYFADYIAPKDLPQYYALTDVTVVPSYLDTWNVVVNESMAAGVPVICSTGAGSSRDLIKSGKSGLIFENGNVQQLVSAIETMLSSEDLRKNMVIEADKILEDYTIEKARDQFLDAVNKTYLMKKAEV